MHHGPGLLWTFLCQLWTLLKGWVLEWPGLFCSHGHVYFVMISGPINVLGKTVEIHGT